MRPLILAVLIASCAPARSVDYAPGDVVPAEAVSESMFYSVEVPDSVARRMNGLSYKDDCTVPLSELRYLRVLHKDIDGNVKVGEMVCNKSIAEDLLYIFKELFRASYPIERMVLVDDYGADDERSMKANNSSCFNFRFISGTSKVSVHGMGMAVDINPLYNPYLKVRDGKRIVEPAGAGAYTDRSRDFKYKIEPGDICCRLFRERGFEWGGDWKSVKDWQHFEKH